MIEAKDLRIGNCVKAPWGEYCKIKMLTEEDVIAEPIPLTPEILEKAGF